jgi:hypothetical protein
MSFGYQQTYTFSCQNSRQTSRSEQGELMQSLAAGVYNARNVTTKYGLLFAN